MQNTDTEAAIDPVDSPRQAEHERRHELMCMFIDPVLKNIAGKAFDARKRSITGTRATDIYLKCRKIDALERIAKALESKAS